MCQAFFFVLLQGLLTFPEKHTDPLQPIHPSIVKLFQNTQLFCSNLLSFFPGSKIPATRCQFHPSLPLRCIRKPCRMWSSGASRGNSLKPSYVGPVVRCPYGRRDLGGGGLETAGVKGRGPGEVRLTLRNS